jgi:hypothetical protein
MKRLAFVLCATLSLCVALVAQGPAARPAPEVYSQLRWRFVGPEGNRISAVAGISGDPLVYYAGSASGGLAKTTDGGVHWQQVFDDQPVQSIGVTSRLATASTNRLTPGSRGRIWVSTKRVGSRV